MRALALLLLLATPALAQPTFQPGQTLTAAELNAAFAQTYTYVTTLPVTSTNGHTLSLATWMGYLDGTANPYPVVFGSSVGVSGTLTVGGATVQVPLSGTTASLGGSALVAGACVSTTVTVTGATTGMAIITTPVTYPGAGFDWGRSYVSATNTVTVQVCADVAGTPTASAYNVRVLQ